MTKAYFICNAKRLHFESFVLKASVSKNPQRGEGFVTVFAKEKIFYLGQNYLKITQELLIICFEYLV